jgi:predicted PurR-regulated permease PerM
MSIEISESVLNYGLASLAFSGVIVLLVVGGFLAKLIYDASKLTQNINKTTDIVNEELKPTLDELNRAIKSFNNIVQNTGEGVGNVKLGLENVLAKTKIFSGNLVSGFMKGFLTVYSILGRRK